MDVGGSRNRRGKKDVVFLSDKTQRVSAASYSLGFTQNRVKVVLHLDIQSIRLTKNYVSFTSFLSHCL